MSLEKSIEEAQLAVNYFFNNNFNEAKKLMEPWLVQIILHDHVLTSFDTQNKIIVSIMPSNES